jgi:hypothetical protein
MSAHAFVMYHSVFWAKVDLILLTKGMNTFVTSSLLSDVILNNRQTLSIVLHHASAHM